MHTVITKHIFPNESIALKVVSLMTNEKVLSVVRMQTGEQHFVFAVTTENSEYVLRMAVEENKHKFSSGIYWQEKLIPLGVPLAKFIKIDLDKKYSQFSSLLMMRLPGDDLCNVYSKLTDTDKKNLAQEMVKIQALTNALPNGIGYGILDSYEHVSSDMSWYDFLMNRLNFYIDIIKKNSVFNIQEIEKVMVAGKSLEKQLLAINSRPFLWDASERNVIVNNGKISGIVDVDEICFGDPLFVIGLTHVALAIEGHDTLYTDYWAKILRLNVSAQARLIFYKLFYVVVFMRKHSMTSVNQQKIIFNIEILQNMLQNLLLEFDK